MMRASLALLTSSRPGHGHRRPNKSGFQSYNQPRVIHRISITKFGPRSTVAFPPSFISLPPNQHQAPGFGYSLSVLVLKLIRQFPLSLQRRRHMVRARTQGLADAPSLIHRLFLCSNVLSKVVYTTAYAMRTRAHTHIHAITYRWRVHNICVYTQMYKYIYIYIYIYIYMHYTHMHMMLWNQSSLSAFGTPWAAVKAVWLTRHRLVRSSRGCAHRGLGCAGIGFWAWHLRA